MVKFVLFLIGLLHLCHSATMTKELNTEMIDRLEKLNKLYNENKVNITSPEDVRVPTISMHRHARHCAGVFFNHLENLLNNVTVDRDSNYILEELKETLQALGPREMKNDCRMSQRVGREPFESYAEFLRKLNRSVRR